MKLRTFLAINAVVAVIVGLLLIFIPHDVVRWFGLALDKGIDVDGQLYGSTLILMGLVCWVARDITESRIQRNIVGVFTIANLISLILVVIGEVTRTFDAIGWFAIAAYLILTVVYGYYWYALGRQAPEMRPMEQHSEAIH